MSIGQCVDDGAGQLGPRVRLARPSQAQRASVQGDGQVRRVSAVAVNRRPITCTAVDATVREKPARPICRDCRYLVK